MPKKTPQQLASDYKKDSPMMRAGFVKAMKIISEADNIPQSIRQIANDCINIISGISDYNVKTVESNSEVELPQPKKPEPPKEQPKPKTSANWRFRRRG